MLDDVGVLSPININLSLLSRSRIADKLIFFEILFIIEICKSLTFLNLLCVTERKKERKKVHGSNVSMNGAQQKNPTPRDLIDESVIMMDYERLQIVIMKDQTRPRELGT